MSDIIVMHWCGPALVGMTYDGAPGNCTGCQRYFDSDYKPHPGEFTVYEPAGDLLQHPVTERTSSR